MIIVKNNLYVRNNKSNASEDSKNNRVTAGVRIDMCMEDIDENGKQSFKEIIEKLKWAGLTDDEVVVMKEFEIKEENEFFPRFEISGIIRGGISKKDNKKMEQVWSILDAAAKQIEVVLLEKKANEES